MTRLARPEFSIDPAVFYPALVLLAIGVVAVVTMPGDGAAVFADLQAAIVKAASWFYVLVIALIAVMVLVLSVSRYGDIKLGPDHAEPDYGFLSWFSMLFAAGVGVGLLFYGVAEPVLHFLSPPVGEGGTEAAAAGAMQLTYLHWGFNAWATYAAVAMVLAYFSYRHNLPLTLRSAFYPLIGDRIYGPMGASVDVFAVICTTCGISVSLGLGVLQINTGLNYLFGVAIDAWVQVLLIFATMAVATVSVILGLDSGIKRLSEINTVLAVSLLLLILFAGPTALLLSGTLQNFGGYIASVVPRTFDLYVYAPTNWLGDWTIFYWGWWISWTPFVGIFVARISRGRTIREFLIGVTVVPTLFVCLWLGVLGGSGIELILNQGVTELGDAIIDNPAVGLFRFLEFLPATELLSMICLGMIVIFFVTSADSGAMVLNMLSARGRDDTPALQRSIWTLVIAITASVLLLGGGLQALQAATIASALPFAIALLGAFWGFAKSIRVDGAKRQAVSTPAPPPAQAQQWRERLTNLFEYPADSTVRAFQKNTVVPAMQAFAKELAGHGVDAVVSNEADPGARLEVYHGNEVDFVYAVQERSHSLPDASIAAKDQVDAIVDGSFSRAEVHLAEGGQDYDVMGWSEEQIIVDILNQYEDHLHFLHTVRS
ncbi:MAG: BCCT family transporter [Halieaceae bacterium]|nr:BCCT family transporter [Halieaceae bacterium]